MRGLLHLEILQLGCPARRHHLRERTEGRPKRLACAAAVPDSRTLNFDQPKNRPDLASVPTLEAQPCIAVRTVRVRRGNCLTLAADQKLLYCSKQSLALGKTHSECIGCKEPINRSELNPLRATIIIYQMGFDNHSHDGPPDVYWLAIFSDQPTSGSPPLWPDLSKNYLDIRTYLATKYKSSIFNPGLSRFIKTMECTNDENPYYSQKRTSHVQNIQVNKFIFSENNSVSKKFSNNHVADMNSWPANQSQLQRFAKVTKAESLEIRNRGNL